MVPSMSMTTTLGHQSEEAIPWKRLCPCVMNLALVKGRLRGMRHFLNNHGLASTMGAPDEGEVFVLEDDALVETESFSPPVATHPRTCNLCIIHGERRW